MGLLLLTGQFEVKATGIPAKTRDAKKRERPATTQTKNASVVHFFRKQNGLRRRRKIASRNGFVSDVYCRAAK